MKAILLFYKWIGVIMVVWIIILAIISSPIAKNHVLPALDPLTSERVSRIETLDQGWGWNERLAFYNANQGSQLTPYKWYPFLVRPTSKLEKGSEDTVFSPTNLARYGFLPQESDEKYNLDGLALGFVKDPQRPGSQSGDWLGLTCAACHTSQINYKGVGYLIDGGPGQGDIQSLLLEITEALRETRDIPERFNQFAHNVLHQDGEKSTDVTELKKALQTQCEVREKFDHRNLSSDEKYGFCRVDAFGIIMNQVLQNVLNIAEDGNNRPADAPVSYPFLWDTPHHDFVQWNGAAANQPFGTSIVGPLSRNVGEVLGVFGNVDIATSKNGGYDSSVRRLNLIWIEEQLKELYSPQWPKSFPVIDKELAKKGAVLFNQYCVSCHQPIDRTNPHRLVEAKMSPLSEIKTDPKMTTNFADRVGKTGSLHGHKSLFFAGAPLGEEAPAGKILSHVILGIIVEGLVERHNLMPIVDKNDLNKSEDILKRTMVAAAVVPPSYKARPLNGIWATAPYLHNGSVPNLDELLKPAEKRVETFYLGTREFDPVKVGFISDKEFPGSFKFNTKASGNRNTGHEYGPETDDGIGFNPAERRQLIEYLKTL